MRRRELLSIYLGVSMAGSSVLAMEDSSTQALISSEEQTNLHTEEENFEDVFATEFDYKGAYTNPPRNTSKLSDYIQFDKDGLPVIQPTKRKYNKRRQIVSQDKSTNKIPFNTLKEANDDSNANLATNGDKEEYIELDEKEAAEYANENGSTEQSNGYFATAYSYIFGS